MILSWSLSYQFRKMIVCISDPLQSITLKNRIPCNTFMTTNLSIFKTIFTVTPCTKHKRFICIRTNGSMYPIWRDHHHIARLCINSITPPRFKQSVRERPLSGVGISPDNSYKTASWLACRHDSDQPHTQTAVPPVSPSSVNKAAISPARQSAGEPVHSDPRLFHSQQPEKSVHPDPD